MQKYLNIHKCMNIKRMNLNRGGWHACCNWIGAMTTPAHITNSLKRLSDLEFGSGTLASALSDAEKRHEINRLRSVIPASILGHHDRMLQRGKQSIVPVLDGICSSCHLRLPIGHIAHLKSSQDLEVCDNCGAFIYFEPSDETSFPVAPQPVRKKRRPGILALR